MADNSLNLFIMVMSNVFNKHTKIIIKSKPALKLRKIIMQAGYTRIRILGNIRMTSVQI